MFGESVLDDPAPLLHLVAGRNCDSAMFNIKFDLFQFSDRTVRKGKRFKEVRSSDALHSFCADAAMLPIDLMAPKRTKATNHMD